MSLECFLDFQCAVNEKMVLDRWFGESITYVSFNQQSFSINAKGFPVLPVGSEKFLKKCFSTNINPLVTLTAPMTSKSMMGYFQYYAFGLKKLVENVFFS